MWRIYASVNKVTILSDYGLSPNRHQAIIWNNDDSNGSFRTNLSEIWSKIQRYSNKKTSWKTSSAKLRRFCLGLHVFTGATHGVRVAEKQIYGLCIGRSHNTHCDYCWIIWSTYVLCCCLSAKCRHVVQNVCLLTCIYFVHSSLAEEGRRRERIKCVRFSRFHIKKYSSIKIRKKWWQFICSCLRKP